VSKALQGAFCIEGTDGRGGFAPVFTIRPGALWGAQAASAQASSPCVNDVPDSYQRGVRFAPLPDGRNWGSTAGVAVAPDGTIWAYGRCGANSCAGSSLDPIIAFSPDGKVLRHFGGDLLQMPHGLTVDASGNVWVTDNAAKDGRGMQVFKLGPEGQILMTLGEAGGGEAPDGFFQPNAVAIASNGDIFVAQNHTAHGDKSRVLVFSPEGKFIKSFGGKGSIITASRCSIAGAAISANGSSSAGQAASW
jgi:DNA-binding beta-propeller fold protein YncE